ncbi:MAG: GNAT family N-acetyltransferase [Saprospiraceae bacterium]|nr:GNAT family N-acetyltransferase [Saprospiraceae bacterium]
MTPTPRISPEALRYRPIEPADEALLYSIYASTRAEEMALVQHVWSQEQINAFLNQQFQAQHQYYQQLFPNRDFRIILYDEVPAGRLYLDERPDDIRIVDITLLPDFRNRGLGEYILRSILEKAASAGKTVSIHVERMNPARHLYDRLGFRMIDDSNQVYLLMEWKS